MRPIAITTYSKNQSIELPFAVAQCIHHPQLAALEPHVGSSCGATPFLDYTGTLYETRITTDMTTLRLGWYDPRR